MSYDIHGNATNNDIHGNAMDRNIHGNRPMDIHGNHWDGSGSGSGGWSGSGGSGSGSSYGGSSGGSYSGDGGGSGAWVLFLVVATIFALGLLGDGMRVVNDTLGLGGGWATAFWVVVAGVSGRLFPRLVGSALLWVGMIGTGIAGFVAVITLIGDVSMIAGPLLAGGGSLLVMGTGAFLKAWGETKAARRRAR